eukprot:TRINITY_DN57935_c0_g1_i1.p1 TRINITY_DN57935_c0_g1~~TRINITY_DN57935_c0_g1_i1.p1  ORF type:complete len:280 (-),score=99.12 TRINITY_DN57935_c0_g1_i1:342-1181(-)
MLRAASRWVGRRLMTSAVSSDAAPVMPMLAREARRVAVMDLCAARVPYMRAWEWQKDVVRRRVKRKPEDCGDVLFLLEHDPVFTLGRGASVDNLKFDPDSGAFELHRVDRGGEVTYHCPGQLVGYPILDLRHYKQDLHWYLRQVEEVIIRVLDAYGLQGERDEEYTGVWVDNTKVAAIGINASSWFTMHGFALNVRVDDLGPFTDAIVPCGIEDRGVSSMHDLVRQRDPERAAEVTLANVRRQVLREFEQVFNAECVVEADCAEECEGVIESAYRLKKE